MSKKEQELRGGLNLLFGNQRQEKPLEAEEVSATEAPTDEVEPTNLQTKQEELIAAVDDPELREALHKRRIRGRGRPRKGASSPEQTKLYTRISTIAHKDKYAKICEISLRESLQIKEVLEAAMDLAISAYEEKHGEIVINQKKKRGNPEDLFK